MFNATNEWIAAGVFGGVVALAALYIYAVTARERRRRFARHKREDELRRSGA